MNNHEFGKLLKLARQRKNWTQEQLASELAVTVSAVSKWETGKNLPDLDIIFKLSEVLSISIEDLHHPKEMIAYLEGKSSMPPKVLSKKAPYTSPFLSLELATDSSKKDSKCKLSLRKHLRVIILSSILLVLIFLGIVLYSHTQDTPDSYIIQVAFRIAEDEQCGTVYEVACVYNVDLDDITLTSSYIDSLSSDWHNNSSVQSDITIMKLSFYNTEENARQWDIPEKSIYLVR